MHCALEVTDEVGVKIFFFYAVCVDEISMQVSLARSQISSKQPRKPVPCFSRKPLAPG